MNTTGIILVGVLLLVGGLAISIPGVLAYRTLLLRAPLSVDEQLKELRLAIDTSEALRAANERTIDQLLAETKQLKRDNDELRYSIKRLSAQVVALGGTPVIDSTKLAQ